MTGLAKKKTDAIKIDDGTPAKDIFDLDPTKAKDLNLDENRGIEDKEMTKDVLPETKDATEDLPSQEKWVEEKEGKILPLEKSGKSEEPISDTDIERFAKQDKIDFAPDLPKKENLEDVLPAGFEDVTMTKGKDAEKKGHKTKSGL